MTTIRMGRRFRPPVWGLALAIALVAELVTFSTINVHFFGGGAGMLDQIELFLPTGILALGLVPVILTGSIDLSVGSTASLSSVVAGVLLLDHQSPVVAIAVAVALSGLIGLVNGLLIALLGIDSLLVTLATQFIAGSLAVSLAGDNPPFGFPDAFIMLGQGQIGPVPIPLVIFLVLAVAVGVLVSRTRFGRRVVLTGYNAAAARYAGISATRTLLGVFTLSGLLAGVSGVLLAGYYDAGRPDSGISLLLPAITCVVLGGVDIFGGRGRTSEVVLAVFVLGYLTQGLLNSGVSSLTATMMTGLLLVVALVVKIAFERRSDESVLAALRNRFGARLRAIRPTRPRPDESGTG